MKTLTVISIIAVFAACVTLAASVAFASLPFALEITATIVAVAGLLSIMFSDYARVPPQLGRSATVVMAVATRGERFGLAA